MTHETELIDVPEQHSIDKVLFGDSIDAVSYTHLTLPTNREV